jgi:hypothetical protein
MAVDAGQDLQEYSKGCPAVYSRMSTRSETVAELWADIVKAALRDR